MHESLQRQFGNIDIYLFDQLLKGTYDQCKTIIDVGCGYGRNIVYLLQRGFDVYGVDPNSEAIESVRELASRLSGRSNSENFRVESAEELSSADSYFNLAICSAVLHFAKDDNQFNKMLAQIWRVIKPGG